MPSPFLFISLWGIGCTAEVTYQEHHPEAELQCDPEDPEPGTDCDKACVPGEDDPGTACALEGQRCHYADGICSYVGVCANGYWVGRSECEGDP